MNNTDMQIFLAIVKNRSITRAAETLFLSQSTVSHRLMALEAETGAQLITRNQGQKSIELTSAGEDFVSIAQRWITLNEEATSLHERPPRLKLSVAGVHSVNFYIFPQLYINLISHDPSLELSLNTHHTWEIYEMMEAREVDIGFVNNVSGYSKITTRPVIHEKFCVLRLARQTTGAAPIHPNELDPDKELFHIWCPEYQQWHDYWWKPSKPVVVRLNIASMLASFLNHEDYWAIVPESVANALKKSHPFESCDLLEPPPDRVCYLITPQPPRPGSAQSMQIFNDCLEDFLKAYHA